MKDGKQSGSLHWSKDFIEHLRTVHFALITVSVGLVLLVLTSRQYNPGTAISQLENLTGVANFWDADRFLAGKTLPELTGDRRYPRTIELQPANNPKPVQISLNIVRFWWPLASGDERNENRSQLAINNYKSKPSSENILALRLWWSFHSEAHNFNIVTKIQPEGAVTSTEPTQRSVELQKAAHLLPAIRNGYSLPYKIDVELTPSAGRWLLTGISDPALGQPTAAPFRLSFDVEVRTVTIHASDFVNVPYDCGAFDSCFPDLAKAARGFELMNLAEFKNHLAQELEKGDTAFEAFGLKVPTALLTTWGIVVVLSVQLYFFIHIREFHAKIKKDDSGWDVPWIGVYDSRLSRAVYLSTLLTPVVAVALIAVRGMLGCGNALAVQQWWRFKAVIIAEIALLVISVCFSGLMSWSTWKHRPTAIQNKAASSAVA